MDKGAFKSIAPQNTLLTTYAKTNNISHNKLNNNKLNINIKPK